MVTSGGVIVRGLASWDGVGASDYSGYTLQGTVKLPAELAEACVMERSPARSTADQRRAFGLTRGTP